MEITTMMRYAAKQVRKEGGVDVNLSFYKNV